MTAWIVCQLGAREHYAIPRALHQSGQLRALITDAWVSPDNLAHRLPSRAASALGDRYHPDLADSSVQSFTASLLAFEVFQRFTQRRGWSTIMARNQWFQYQALRCLERLEKSFLPGDHPILFSYSYTALALFRYAKQRGWRTVLGQIDPGLAEQNQVAQLQERYHQQYASAWTPAPETYWQNWYQECQMADQILVNSTWSQQALEAVGDAQVSTVPLAYQAPTSAKDFVRHYPNTFTADRPLRALFLGQIILRKGIAALIEAITLLSDEPIEIWLVGSTEFDLAAAIQQHAQLKWFGSVPRSQVMQYYQQADVFLFPTHSDGFGLTQLEAQSWKLPIIASRYCGEVVAHQHNGLLLNEVSGESIAASLRICYQHPEYLQRWAGQAINMDRYNLTQLATSLRSLAIAPH